jgi:hypothetical protein
MSISAAVAIFAIVAFLFSVGFIFGAVRIAQRSSAGQSRK